jgi:signal peptidase II
MDTPAVGSPRIRRAAVGIAVLVLAADQISKALVVAGVPHGSRGGLVSVRLVRNTGASFGIGAGHPVVITIVAAAVLAAAVIWLVRTRRPGVALCLAVVAGGAAGNLADRLLRSPGPGRGAVVDWIHVAGYPSTFNLADVAIRAGVVGAVVAALTAGRWKALRATNPGRRFPRLGTLRRC